MSYQQLLNKMPDHQSPGFIDWLRANNPVVYENEHWLVIENFKYHFLSSPWLVAFAKTQQLEMTDLLTVYKDWGFLKNLPKDITVNRVHFHIYRQSNLVLSLIFPIYCRARYFLKVYLGMGE